jgi:hypothetical protein
MSRDRPSIESGGPCRKAGDGEASAEPDLLKLVSRKATKCFHGCLQPRWLDHQEERVSKLDVTLVVVLSLRTLVRAADCLDQHGLGSLALSPRDLYTKHERHVVR